MRKTWMVIGLSFAALLSGCAYGMNESKSLYERNGTTINVRDRNDLYNTQGVRNGTDSRLTNFGYVRHQGSPIPGNRTQYGTMPTLNRENVADLISKLCTQLPNVHDVGTLVTDEEVLIVYKTDSTNRFETADQVKKTAISVVPRYYHVYVSDNPRMFQEIERYGRLDSNSRNIDQIIDPTIKEMLKSPQGRKLNKGENENGEAIGEMNDRLDRDFRNRTAQ
ncbi:sporulation lipoprotein YhcN/YlaJ [Thermolongibacillus altinsuensis]|uniref:Sporulation lipoprotein YhcN/YlaJ n=2 Tax=Thermolongibacillus altinsuensis TaxID=575256 RepID=A0A4R1QK70_9BACL|nr:YhcN/YlaJ family sporulation lipoprotein [Thermolongibacillus altinsuensis]TCL47346.1 sporulation lipoprotein YhcN/YlaJ [Thermolongibacillus altinsuensis]